MRAELYQEGKVSRGGRSMKGGEEEKRKKKKSKKKKRGIVV